MAAHPPARRFPGAAGRPDTLPGSDCAEGSECLTVPQAAAADSDLVTVAIPRRRRARHGRVTVDAEDNDILS